MVEEQVSDCVEQVARVMPCLMRRLFAPPAEQSPLWDLPLPQMRTLHLLRRRRDLTMREVAEGLKVAVSTATQLADRLAGLGLVERLDDAADRRVVRLALTEKGHAALDDLHQQRSERIAAAMSQLTPEEQETVLTGLRLLDQAARQGAPEPCGRHPLWEVVTATLQPETENGNQEEGTG
jgi:DNA-binding MarR family transcriptional regulator